MKRPSIDQVVAELDDETLFTTMLNQFVSTFPSFDNAPPRVKATRDRLIRLCAAAPDGLDAAEKLLRATIHGDHAAATEALGLLADFVSRANGEPATHPTQEP